jgi:glutamate formiminotransferase/formiminotetrahydrofolate cyclodeaminase
MQTSFQSLDLIEAMVNQGMKSSVSDVGVAALCVQTAVHGAYLNVKINASSIEDRLIADDMLNKGKIILQQTKEKVSELLEKAESKM